MQGILPDLILIFVLFQRGLAKDISGNQYGTESCASGDCSAEDEGPCIDDGETKLYRWDPIKVCQSESQK